MLFKQAVNHFFHGFGDGFTGTKIGVTTVCFGKPRGINRVAWPLNVKPPLVPPAASIAGSSTQGPRVPPGTYTVRMTKGDHVYTDKIAVTLDPRSPFSVAERKAQFDATMKVHGMFGRMSDLVARIQAVRAGAAASAGKLPQDDALRMCNLLLWNLNAVPTPRRNRYSASQAKELVPARRAVRDGELVGQDCGSAGNGRPV